MNILVAATGNIKSYAMCENPYGYVFNPPGSGGNTCPCFCPLQCSQKTVACHQPTVAGMSPTGIVSEC